MASKDKEEWLNEVREKRIAREKARIEKVKFAFYFLLIISTSYVCILG